jgi:hypothetical protein
LLLMTRPVPSGVKFISAGPVCETGGFVRVRLRLRSEFWMGVSPVGPYVNVRTEFWSPVLTTAAMPPYAVTEFGYVPPELAGVPNSVILVGSVLPMENKETVLLPGLTANKYPPNTYTLCWLCTAPPVPPVATSVT